jgi:hypothetical protein
MLRYLIQLSTQAPVPTYEQYAEVLPKISPFERDIFLRKAFKQNPILLDILELIATGTNFFFVYSLCAYFLIFRTSGICKII